ncbi:endosialin [Tachyglossus aculeatus]|uniref:endosialin n=1 Tax=Tachyglossus aculeatus TaxID=9261 RepID=UPI0018F39D44|nr:endosialin [Tachyglossus aculeatus]
MIPSRNPQNETLGGGPFRGPGPQASPVGRSSTRRDAHEAGRPAVGQPLAPSGLRRVTRTHKSRARSRAPRVKSGRRGPGPGQRGAGPAAGGRRREPGRGMGAGAGRAGPGSRLQLLPALLVWATLGPSLGQPPGEEARASCGPDSCYVAFFRRRGFLDAWLGCRDLGGNLATLKTPEVARRVARLLLSPPTPPRGPGGPDEGPPRLVWIGLQRQPRQCHPQRPLRGFTWATGDQDTAFTNWAEPRPVPGPCPAPRCVAMEATGEGHWLEGSCTLPVDGYLCQFGFKGACPALAPEPGQGGPAVYTTPFDLVTSDLDWLPFGSVADVPCLAGGRVSLLCAQGPEAVAWSRQGPLCPPAGPPGGCGLDNGGCEQDCLEGPPGQPPRCRCADGYRLDVDGRSCLDACSEAPCEQQCESGSGSGPGYSCHCRLGFRTADEDPHRCLDIDECRIAGVCQQMCVNYVGGFECYCREGHELEADGVSCRPLGPAAGGAGGGPPGGGEEGEHPGEEGGHPGGGANPDHIRPDDTGGTLWDAFAQAWTDSPGPLWLDPPTRRPPWPPLFGPPTVRWDPWVPSVHRPPPPTTHTPPGVTSQPPRPQTSLPPDPSPSGGGGGPVSPYGPPTRIPDPSPPPPTALGVDGPPGRSRRDDRWLLAALLVPACVFLVILLALGIVYCARCGPRAHSKSVTDCYHWITNSGGKGDPEPKGIRPPGGATCRTSV